jgi:hypothetical protein
MRPGRPLGPGSRHGRLGRPLGPERRLARDRCKETWALAGAGTSSLAIWGARWDRNVV